MLHAMIIGIVAVVIFYHIIVPLAECVPDFIAAIPNLLLFIMQILLAICLMCAFFFTLDVISKPESSARATVNSILKEFI